VYYLTDVRGVPKAALNIDIENLEGFRDYYYIKEAFYEKGNCTNSRYFYSYVLGGTGFGI
jgi:hypothetical protein